jgi:hypothetical protein
MSLAIVFLKVCRSHKLKKQNKVHRKSKYLLSTCFLFFAALAAFSGCAGNKNEMGSTAIDGDYISKLDAPLRSVLTNTERDKEAPIDVLIQLTGAADSDVVEMLRHYQLEVRSTVGAIVTARGSAESIRKAASDPRIVSVSLSQIREHRE